MSIPEMSQSMKCVLATVVAVTAALALPAVAEAQMGGPALVKVAVTQFEQTRSDRDAARGDLTVAKARLEQNESQLDRTAVRAPFDGIVIERLMTPGEWVTEGSNVVRLVDQQNLEVIAPAPLDFEAGAFPVGQTLRVSIPTSDSREVLTVPRDALVLRPEGQSVFVDEENTARQVSVRVGVGNGDDIEILGELAPADRVVIGGNERLQQGQAVDIMDS